MDEGGDFLEAGAGGADAADVAAPHHVGEAQRNAVDDGRAAVRSHDQKAVGIGVSLEGDFIGLGYAGAEQHDVEPQPQRLQRLGGGVFARHRDQRQAGAGVPQAHGQAAGQGRLRARGGAGCGPVLVKLFRERGEGAFENRGVAAADGHQHVGRGAFGIAVQQPRIAQQRPVPVGGHHRGRGVHAGRPAQSGRQLHERQGIAVAIADDSRQSNHRSCRFAEGAIGFGCKPVAFVAPPGLYYESPGGSICAARAVELAFGGQSPKLGPQSRAAGNNHE